MLGRGDRQPLVARASFVRLVILAFVAVLALDHYQQHLSRTPGIDFYQYWAVPTARRLSSEPLGSPYSESARYAEVLATFSEQSADPRLRAVNAYRQEPGFASDPLLYVLGSWLPEDYTTALRSYQLLQFAALGLALFLLARQASIPGLEMAILALLMGLYYLPVLSELRVLNTNALQLAALALAVALLGSERSRVGGLEAGLALSLTVFVAFLKPVWAPLPALTMLHLIWRNGWAASARPIAGAAGVAALLFAWPAAVFGPAVWNDWFHRVFRDDPGRLVYAIEEGNRSAPVILARATGWSLSAAAGFLAGVVLLPLLVVLVAQWRAMPSRDLRASLGALTVRLLARPAVALSFGIVAMLALSPLVWWHYYTLALLPIFVLISPGASRWQVALAVLSFLMSSGRLGPIYVWFGDSDWATICGVGFAWLPLLLGLALPFAAPRVDPAGE